MFSFGLCAWKNDNEEESRHLLEVTHSSASLLTIARSSEVMQYFPRDVVTLVLQLARLLSFLLVRYWFARLLSFLLLDTPWWLGNCIVFIMSL